MRQKWQKEAPGKGPQGQGKWLVPKPWQSARPHYQKSLLTWKHLQKALFLVRPLARLSDEVFLCTNQRSLTNWSVGCCFSGWWHWSCILCHCGTVSWLHVWSILFADLSEPIFLWTDDRVVSSPRALRAYPLFNRYVRPRVMTNPTLSKHYLTNPPFLDFTVVLDSTTFATTLILLNNYFIVTAWSCENNSPGRMTMWPTSRFSTKVVHISKYTIMYRNLASRRAFRRFDTLFCQQNESYESSSIDVIR